MHLVIILMGFSVLLFGRRLFWLFVAIAGFLVGIEFTRVFLADQPYWVMLLGGLSAGLLGALLAIFVERIAFAIAGFYAGAYLALILAHGFGAWGSSMHMFAFGGIIGAVFSLLFMDWAIILLSCLVGAGAIVSQLDLVKTISVIIFAALVAVGTLIQARSMEQS